MKSATTLGILSSNFITNMVRLHQQADPVSPVQNHRLLLLLSRFRLYVVPNTLDIMVALPSGLVHLQQLVYWAGLGQR